MQQILVAVDESADREQKEHGKPEAQTMGTQDRNAKDVFVRLRRWAASDNAEVENE